MCFAFVNFCLSLIKLYPFLFLATTSQPEIINPCNPSPCGVNAECRQQNLAAACICLPGLQGNPYIECKPECTLNTECQDHLACVQQKCVDPCPGVCGQNARCKVQFHNPTCICDFGFYGDPFSSCVRTTSMNYFTNNFNLIKELNINYLFFSPSCGYSSCGSLQSIPLWIQCYLFRKKPCSSMSMHPRILWRSLCSM